KAAEAGDTEAMRFLGFNYEHGIGVENDPEQAVSWYRKAVEAGDTTAMCNLGVCYQQGIGVEKDPEQAVSWYQKAVEAGDKTAMCNLGVCYQQGIGVEKDPEQAVSWYQKAAEVGDTTAMRFLGINYEQGIGVEKNPEQAASWYKKAAEAGDTEAMRFLGINFQQGIGVEKNPEQAISWYKKAAEAGDRAARPLYATLSAIIPGSDAVTLDDEKSAIVPSVNLTGQWKDVPPIRAAWQDADVTEARGFAKKLATAAKLENNPDIYDGLSITALRQARLPFYEALKLIDVQFTDKDNNNRFVSSLISEYGAILLDGTSQRLHTLNPHCLSLDTIEKSEGYLRFFCEFVRGKDEPFHIVEAANDIPFQDSKTNTLFPKNGTEISPIQLTDPGQREALFTANATVLYSNSLFNSEFLIPDNGIIEMLNDDVLADDLPILKRNYEGIFRSSLHRSDDQ
ncbi:MAG: tetratricopeptide repeat protein, partial [Sneathiella sp.]